MENLYYVIIKWLESEPSSQTDKLSKTIIEEVDSAHVFTHSFAQIRENQQQKLILIRQRERLIKEKEKLQEQKRAIEREKEENMRLILEKQRLQFQKEEMERQIEAERECRDQLTLRTEEMDNQRQEMMDQYQKLRVQKQRILEQKELLCDRMQKIEHLKRLQRLYQEQLLRIAGETEGFPMEEHKEEEEVKEMVEEGGQKQKVEGSQCPQQKQESREGQQTPRNENE